MFNDRSDAGRQLARRLEPLRGGDLVIVGLPRGGVPVAAEVARVLDAPLDVILVRKLGLPFQPELAMGAIGEDGVMVLNTEIVDRAGIGAGKLAAVVDRERHELERRALLYRAGREHVSLAGRTVVVVDDGIATGSTAKAACQVARAHHARRLVLAVPVAPIGWVEGFAGVADELISLRTPSDFAGVGQFYRDFSQTSDEEVIVALDRAVTRSARSSRTGQGRASDLGRSDDAVRDSDVQIRVDGDRLGGHLTIPENPRGLVIFVHGSGSSRHSPRNRFVASVLNKAGLATLLFDLLAVSEERDRANVIDIDLLSERLTAVTNGVASDVDLYGLPIGYFGASTGAAAALRASAASDSNVRAIVSRGGRPDLAGAALGSVHAPTMLIVGGDDRVVLELNREAKAQLRCESTLRVVPDATHLFEEPGTLQAAAELARDWFVSHLDPAVSVGNGADAPRAQPSGSARR